ncbi:MAG: glycosyltransferase [Candidatus Odinarchaeota archaeon]|nr:glycosyltransferase [Candidatus Odinarchaeota archaeon]
MNASKTQQFTMEISTKKEKILPMVSFCIPTLNSERTLERCLKSIRKQKYPRLEIIIIDGYSTDLTIKIAEKYADLVIFSRGTLSEARQLGVENSKGEILALIDSDIIIPHENWLKNAIRLFDDPYVSTVWPILTAPPDSSAFSRCYTNFSMKITIHRLRRNKGIVGGTNALFRKKYIQEVGGFDKRLDWGEDFYIARKLREKGYKVAIHTDPLYHDTMTTLSEFIKKQIRGARLFSTAGIELTGLTLRDLLYEHLAIGARLMFAGLFQEKDVSWIMLPLLVLTRLLVYLILFSRKLLRH